VGSGNEELADLLLKVNRRIRVNETSPSKNFIYGGLNGHLKEKNKTKQKKHYEIGKSNIMPLIQ